MKINLWVIRAFALTATSFVHFGLRADEPVHNIDTAKIGILYGPNGHFYAVYQAASIANMGGKTHYDTEALAFYTELPDKLKATTAFYFGCPPLFAASC